MAEEIKDQVNPADSQPEQKFKIKVQGEEKEVGLTELLELAQKGEDYTRKTQELSEKEKKMAEETQRKAEELAYQYLEDLEKQKSQQPPADADLDPTEKRIVRLEKEIAELKQGSEESTVAQYELRFETELKELKGKYPNLDERVVLATLMANPDLKMEDVAKESHESEVKKWDEKLKKYLEDKKKQPRTEGGGISTIPTVPEKPLTGKDLASGKVREIATTHILQELQQE